MAPPFRVASFDITFGEGISKNGEIVDLGAEHDIIQKSGSWYSYNGAKIAQGREGAKQFLDDNPEVAHELELKIKEKFKRLEDSKSKTAAVIDDEDVFDGADV